MAGESDFAGARRSILEAMFTAQFNALYRDLLQRRYERLEFLMRISVAVVGSSAAAEAIGSGMSAWIVFSGVTTIFATAIAPVLKWPRLIGRIEADRLKWTALKNDYENLWNDLLVDGDWTEAMREFRRIRKRENAIEKEKGLLPSHEGLLNKARSEICARNGVRIDAGDRSKRAD